VKNTSAILHGLHTAFKCHLVTEAAPIQLCMMTDTVQTSVSLSLPLLSYHL